MSTCTPDPDWIRFPQPDMSTALTVLASWEKDRVRFGFYPGAVGIVATEDPSLPWAVEVSQNLFAKSFSEVW
jgi:hypothetical protein